MLYEFKIQGCNFSCDLNNDKIVAEIRSIFPNDIDTILKDKELYRVITDAERIVTLEAENKELRDATIDLGNIVQEQQDALLDLANAMAGGDK